MDAVFSGQQRLAFRDAAPDRNPGHPISQAYTGNKANSNSPAYNTWGKPGVSVTDCQLQSGTRHESDDGRNACPSRSKPPAQQQGTVSRLDVVIAMQAISGTA